MAATPDGIVIQTLWKRIATPWNQVAQIEGCLRGLALKTSDRTIAIALPRVFDHDAEIAKFRLVVLEGKRRALRLTHDVESACTSHEGLPHVSEQCEQTAETENGALLQVDNLKTHFPARGGQVVKAVDGVSLSLSRGETLGLVGESGCGKSTLGRTILRLVPATSGKVYFEGRDVLALRAAEMRGLRRRMQIVFQDPVGSLNPRMRVETIVGEALSVHGLVATARQRRERVTELLQRVGLPAEALNRYPHEFSGGQRQRIGIARALALEPEFIVCDEPVSALDVSIQSQILNLLADLQEEFGLSYLFIAHDLAVVRHFCDRIAVMYLGKIVEQAPTDELFANPRHPYTQALLAAAPRPEPPRAGETAELPVLTGEVPSPLNPPSGCAFHPRCPIVEARCRMEAPELVRPGGMTAEHLAACHLVADTSAVAT
jgi:oligopeptide/dipeptide ABC transporter ATP-binding protein